MRHCLSKSPIRTAVVPALSMFFMLSLAFAEKPAAEVKEPEPKPCEPSTFEWGAGLLSFRMNHYRGSDQYKNYFIPSPYFKYRGENIEAETSYVRGTLYKNDYLILKLSFMVGLSVESDENRAREGMPDLGYMLETGPMLIVKLWESAGRAHLLTLESPVRYVFATDFTGVEPVGVLGLPYINLTSLPRAYTLGWKSEFSVALMIGSRGYHDYFYSVPAKYARPERPEYHARGGYSGVQLAWILERRFGPVQLIPILRWDYLKRAAFEESPLVRTKHYFAAGLGSFYLF